MARTKHPKPKFDQYLYTNKDGTTVTKNGREVGVIIDQSGESWFFANEIAEAYGVSINYLSRHVKKQHKTALRMTDIYPDSAEVYSRVLIINLKGVFAFMMRSDSPRAVEFQDWVIEVLLPAIYNGDKVHLDGTPMQEFQKATASLVARIEILESDNDELESQITHIRMDRDYWKTVATSYYDLRLGDLVGIEDFTLTDNDAL